MEKILDLFEARFIDLLELSSGREDNLFVHSIITSPWEEDEAENYPSAGAFLGLDFALSCNTIVQVR